MSDRVTEIISGDQADSSPGTYVWGRKLALPVVAVLALAVLWFTSYHNYLLFHCIAELFSVAVAIAIFMLAWNARRLLDIDYLLFIGIAYLYIAGLDTLHTMAYKGMGVFLGRGSNLATQLWIVARYMESISLAVAPIFLIRKLPLPRLVILLFVTIAALAITSIFFESKWFPGWLKFPDCYVEGKGLTKFKIVSEYVICGFLLVALACPRALDSFQPGIGWNRRHG